MNDMKTFNVNNNKQLKKVSYQDITTKSRTGAIKIADDYEFNPIPRIDEFVIFDKRVYKVSGVIYDYDKGNVNVMLRFIKMVISETTEDDDEDDELKF